MSMCMFVFMCVWMGHMSEIEVEVGVTEDKKGGMKERLIETRMREVLGRDNKKVTLFIVDY